MSCCRILCFALLTLISISCASRPPAYREQGWASYVADHYTGKPTSSGELYHPQAYTAAHTSLPFGTVVTVKNIMNGRTVNVTVNDRFPYYPGRVINLSSIAAQHIGIPYLQMGQVEVTAKTLPAANYGPPQQNYGGGGNYAPQQQAYSRQQQQSYSPQSYGGGGGGYVPQSHPTSYPGYAPQGGGGYQVQQPAAGAPNAPSYQGGGAPPPGLRTF